MVFGNMESISGDANTELQVTVSEYMQHAWASFAKDPHGALKALGWPLYDPKGQTLIRLGYDSETVASYVSPDEFDSLCAGLGYSTKI